MQLLLILGFLCSLGYTRKLPSYIEVCHRNDPQISQCLVRNVEILRPKFLNGIPELAIPSFNPLTIPEAQLNVGDSLNATFKRIQLWGVEHFILDELSIDIDKIEITVGITIPSMRVKSEYNIKGRLLVLELDGKGPSDGNYTNVKGFVKVSGEHFTKNGADHIRFLKPAVDVDIGNPHLQFDNIFGDNKELNDRTNQIINENISTIIDEVKPVVVEIVKQFIIGTVNRVFAKYSFDEMFPK